MSTAEGTTKRIRTPRRYTKPHHHPTPESGIPANRNPHQAQQTVQPRTAGTPRDQPTASSTNGTPRAPSWHASPRPHLLGAPQPPGEKEYTTTPPARGAPTSPAIYLVLLRCRWFDPPRTACAPPTRDKPLVTALRGSSASLCSVT